GLERFQERTTHSGARDVPDLHTRTATLRLTPHRPESPDVVDAIVHEPPRKVAPVHGASVVTTLRRLPKDEDILRAWPPRCPKPPVAATNRHASHGRRGASPAPGHLA